MLLTTETGALEGYNMIPDDPGCGGKAGQGIGGPTPTVSADVTEQV